VNDRVEAIERVLVALRTEIDRRERAIRDQITSTYETNSVNVSEIRERVSTLSRVVSGDLTGPRRWVLYRGPGLFAAGVIIGLVGNIVSTIGA
jgi:hypothetical protein